MSVHKAPRAPSPDESPTPEEMKVAFARLRPLVKGKQLAIGAALGINQGQLSKILRGDFVFADGHAMKLFEYAKNRLSETVVDSADRPLLQAQLTQKLLAAWDGTREGATALGILLDGAARLRHWR